MTETLPLAKNVAADLKGRNQKGDDQEKEQTFSNCYEIDLKDKM